MTRAQVWDKAKPSVWDVQVHSSFMVEPDSRPSSQGWKYTASFSRFPWGKLSFLGENKSAPSVKGLPVAPKFRDVKCSPRVCFCFSWQLTHPTSYEPFNSNCLPYVPSSSTPWITGWDHLRLLMIQLLQEPLPDTWNDSFFMGYTSGKMILRKISSSPLSPPLQRVWRHNMSFFFVPFYGCPQTGFIAITMQHYSSRFWLILLISFSKKKKWAVGG